MAVGRMRERMPAAQVHAVADATQRDRLVALWALARAARQWRRFSSQPERRRVLRGMRVQAGCPSIVIRAVSQTHTVDRS